MVTNKQILATRVVAISMNYLHNLQDIQGAIQKMIGLMGEVQSKRRILPI